MSTKRSTQKGETTVDVGSTLSKKPKKKNQTNIETEAASSCTTTCTNRNDAFSNEAKIAMKQFTYQIVQSGLHQLRVQYNDLKTFVPADPSKKHFDANPTKCRYKDVPCWDKTRIVLSWPPTGVAGDFVHANRITHDLLETQQFICCQGPLPDTVTDMWRCVWQENVKSIIMLCRCQEMGKEKCAQYWPSSVGEKMSFHGLAVKCEKIDTTDRSFVHTKLSLTFEGKTRTLDHRQWTTWPDKSVPKTPMAPFRLLQYARKYSKNPTIIHCSAGIGRTGTLVMIEMIYRCLLKGKIPDVPQLVKDVRTQRAMAVQTEDQYLYCHYAILQLLHIKKIASSHFIKHFIREYENYLKLLNDVGGKNLPMQATSLPQPCANCAKVAAHMNDIKPTAAADSPPSESNKNEKKEESKYEKKDESKRESGKGSKENEKNPERKANLIKQLMKTQKEKKQGKKETEEPPQDQPPQTSPNPPPAATPTPKEEAKAPPKEEVKAAPKEEAKASEPPVQNNVNQTQIQQPAPQASPAPAPPPPEEQPPLPCNSPPPNQSSSPVPQPPQQQQQQPPQQGNSAEPQQQLPQQQIPQCAATETQQAAAPKQKFQYKAAPTYTIQQAGNKKAIVYHRNANQPFIKAVASPAGIPQPMCLVESNAPPCPQQQQQPPKQNQPTAQQQQ